MLNKNCSHFQETSPGASKTRFVLSGFSSETEDTARAELDTRLFGRGLPGPLCEKGPFLTLNSWNWTFTYGQLCITEHFSWAIGRWWWCCSPRKLSGEIMEIHASSSPWLEWFWYARMSSLGWWDTYWGSISNWYCEFQLPNRSSWKRLLRYARGY